MSKEIIPLIDQFSEALLGEQDIEFACKGKFMKIKVELNSVKPNIPDELPEKTIDEAKVLLHDLNETFKECLEMSKKHENDECTKNLKSLTTLPRVRKLKNRLKNIKNKIERETVGVTPLTQKPDEQTTATNTTQPPIGGRRRSTDYQWSSSFIDETKIHGWDDQVKQIVRPLVDSTDAFTAVGIVGMYGSGKTSLAQKLFVNEEIKTKFVLRLWVCVSPECDREELLRRMLDNLGVELDDVDATLDENSGLERVGVLLFLLYLELLDKSYLVVFDDVDSTDPWFGNLGHSPPPTDKEWTDRLAYGLPKDADDLGIGGGSRGASAVVVTSRREEVARRMVGAKGRIYHPTPLQDELLEEGWTVFEEAFREHGGDGLEMDPSWSEMKRLIVEKCNGLPLTLKVAGRELARQKRRAENDVN